MNIFIENPDFQRLTSMHFYAWKKGLKTGMYYLRSKPASFTDQFTIDPFLKTFSSSISGSNRTTTPQQYHSTTITQEQQNHNNIEISSSTTTTTNLVCTRSQGCVTCGS